MIYIQNYKLIKVLIIISFLLLFFNNSYSQIDELIRINSIEIKGNNKTKKQIILRELSFAVGDNLLIKDLKNKIKAGKKNLLNTPLFNYVDIEIINDSLSKINIVVNVEERWYLWPQTSIYYADRNFSNWLKNRDFSRTDFGLGLVKYNLRGRNEKLSFFSIFGYDEELLFQYENISLDKKRKHLASIFIKQLKRKETGCKIEDDKLKQIKLIDNYALKAYNITIKYEYRNKFFNKHSLYLGFEHRKISDSLINFNPNYTINSQDNLNYFFLKYIFKYDKRNSRIFPTNGYYYKLTATKSGLYFFPESYINSFYIKNEISKYSYISNKFSIGNHITIKYKTEDKNPFFLNNALGYNSNIRGYEYNVINGTNFILFKNTLNYKLITKKTIHLKKLQFKRFNKIHFTVYTSFFTDIAYVKNSDILYNQNNNLANTLLYSSGISLNVLTYYDTLFRIDYSINHLKKGGFYLHFEAPF